MQPTLITRNAESALLALVEECQQQPTSWGALCFPFDRLAGNPSQEDLLLVVRPLLKDREASIYFLSDGDIVITWAGSQKLLEPLLDVLYQRFTADTKRELHTYYDIQAHGERLRILCRRLLARKAQGEAKGEASTSVLQPSGKQLRQFTEATKQRVTRRAPHILAVEDQAFFSRLLRSIIERDYKTMFATTAEDGLEYYTLLAPDLLFLDVQLPGASGHDLAAAINQFDADAHIVMVTANNFPEDVARAKANKARGFIIKPYSKQKILDSIRAFEQARAS